MKIFSILAAHDNNNNNNNKYICLYLCGFVVLYSCRKRMSHRVTRLMLYYIYTLLLLLLTSYIYNTIYSCNRPLCGRLCASRVAESSTLFSAGHSRGYIILLLLLYKQFFSSAFSSSSSSSSSSATCHALFQRHT